jgi:hypothetical protein
MGSGPSKLAGATGLSPGQTMTRQQLLAKTQGSREYINLLFNQMIAKLTPEDYLKLGNPQTCSKFIFMMAESLQKHFIALRIRPARQGDSGVLYFQQLSRLSEDRESRELCLVIAYFFIRLFQVFGALAITCLDDPGAGETLGVLRAPAAPAAPQRFGFFGGPLKPRQKFGPGGTFIGGFQEGGNLRDSGYLRGSRYSILRPILNEPIDSEQKYFPFDGVENIYLYRSSSGSTTDTLQFKLSTDGTEFTVGANLDIISQGGILGSSKQALRIRAFHITSTLDRIIKSRLNVALGGITAKELVITIDNGQITDDDGQKLLMLFTDIYKKCKNITDRIIANPDIGVEDIRRQLAERKDGRQGIPGFPGIGQRTDSFTTIPLNNEYLIQILKSVKTQKMPSFCVARALQLIDAAALYEQSPKIIKSSICFDGDTRVTPQPKGSLDKVPGLRVLDALYKTNPHIKTSKEGSQGMGFEVEVDNPEEYAKFLGDVSTLFGQSSTSAKTKLGDITAKSDMCSDAVKKYIQVNNEVAIKQIVGGVQKMFAFQYAHTQRVMNFFKTRLFLIKKVRNPVTGGTSDYIEIHPAILKGGIPELAKVSKEARELLINYYKNCEGEYQTVSNIIKSVGTRI